jgi:hypothetical protein
MRACIDLRRICPSINAESSGTRDFFHLFALSFDRLLDIARSVRAREKPRFELRRRWIDTAREHALEEDAVLRSIGASPAALRERGSD